MAEPVQRWGLDCGGEGYWSLPMSEDEARALADKVYPPPAVVILRPRRAGGAAWERHGGEARDGGGWEPVEWREVAVETEAAR